MPSRLIVCSAQVAAPGWRWIEDALPGDDLRWEFFLPLPRNALERRVQRPAIARYRAAYETARSAQSQQADLIVSHLPLMTCWTSAFSRLLRVESPHLAFAFNFTALPRGTRRRFMARTFRRIDRFVVPSTVEKRLYAEYFDLPEDRFDMLPWGSRKPDVPEDAEPVESGEYVCAVGGEGRDYGTLMEAMRRLPNIRLVIVVRPFSLTGVSVPENVSVHTNIPAPEAWNIVHYSRFMALPLRDAEVPCGHVTLVGAMHLQKALAVTDSEGVHDYVRHEENGLLCQAKDPAALAEAIQRLWEDEPLARRLGEAGQAFVNQRCTEKETVAYVARYLKSKQII